jgi:hypothetical protein
MILFNPWGLLALLAIPGILAIHLFRRRFRPRAVTGLFLYGPSVRTVAAGRTRQRLLWQTSLLMELLAVLAVTWYLTDPHLDDRQQSRHLVVVLDSRWRVAAQTNIGSVDATLRLLIAQRIAALDNQDRVTLITSATTPVVACGPAARPHEALAVLERWRPQQTWHDLTGALTLARSIADAGATVVLASDRAPEELPPRIGLITAGKAMPTSGLVDARWYADAEGRRIVARVLAQGGAMTRRLELRRGATVIAAQDLALADGTPASLVFPLAGDENGELTLALVGSDPLPQDDQALLIPPAPGTVLVRLALPTDQQPPFARACKIIPGVRLVDDATTAVHLQIGGTVPTSGTWSLRIVPSTAKPVLGPFLARRGHPVLGGLDFTGVLWTGGLPSDGLAELATPLVEAGSTVLVSEERRGRDRDLTLHLDPATSGLTNHPVWPAFLANLVLARRAALPGVRQTNVLTGQEQLVVLPPGRTEATLIAPDGHEARLVAGGDGDLLIPPQVVGGIYRIRLPNETADWQRMNVLACDARLGDLRAAATTVQEADQDGRGVVERQRPFLAHLLPIIAAALVALIGWFAFTREEGRAP